VNVVERTRRGHDRPVFRQRKGTKEEEIEKGGKKERERERKFRKGESSFSTTRHRREMENEVAAEFSFPRDTVVCFPLPLLHPPPSASSSPP